MTEPPAVNAAPHTYGHSQGHAVLNRPNLPPYGPYASERSKRSTLRPAAEPLLSGFDRVRS